MKKRIFSLMMVVCLLFTTIGLAGIVTVKADEGVLLRVHYLRDDSNYDDWDVWMWAAGADGKAYDFMPDSDGDMVAEARFKAGTEQVGYIVRKSDWSAKDVDMDQFIDTSGVIAGTVDAYITSGVEGAEVILGEDVIIGIAVRSARAEGNEISVTLTGKAGQDIEDKIKVFDIAGNEINLSEVQVQEDSITIITVEELDIAKKYILNFDGTDVNIITPDVFSTEAFESRYTYLGDDLGAVWTADKTAFRVWAPTADLVKVNLYESGDAAVEDLIETIVMTEDINGTWIAEKSGDVSGLYYTYLVEVNGQVNEACDPYARATGVNGNRAMVIDLSSTNPSGWEEDFNPNADLDVTDAVIYELHIRDFSYDESSGMDNKGKYLAFTETGTKNSAGMSTGVDYLKDLGITHLHLLPAYDYGSVDETKLDTDQFNWGYDPKNYNVPEGSYATDPYHGEVRVHEFKQMVQSLHDNEISVVMDVVYNHTHNTDFCMNQIVPGYFYRIDESGAYSNGSGCGNDVASERAMVKKYIVDSVAYWASEYHIDGFRFDLVGLLDADTINEIREEVDKIDPSIILYGEGWTMDTYTTKNHVTLATQENASQVNGFAFFSDNIRDGMKGSVFDALDKGYINGNGDKKEEIIKAVAGLPDWAANPAQVVNYTSCHDNLTLWDKIASSNPEDSFDDRVKQNNLAAAIVFTSQGIPFVHAGEEILRTKLNDDGSFNENSYASSSAVNSIKWDDLTQVEYMQVREYYKGLIEFRNEHAALRMLSGDESKANITFADGLDENVIAYTLNQVNGEIAEKIFVVYNPNTEVSEVTLPDGTWKICVNDEKAGTEIIEKAVGSIRVNPISCMVLVQGKANLDDHDTEELVIEQNVEPTVVPTSEPAQDDDTKDEESKSSKAWIVILCIVVAAGAAVGIILYNKKKNNSVK